MLTSSVEHSADLRPRHAQRSPLCFLFFSWWRALALCRCFAVGSWLCAPVLRRSGRRRPLRLPPPAPPLVLWALARTALVERPPSAPQRCRAMTSKELPPPGRGLRGLLSRPAALVASLAPSAWAGDVSVGHVWPLEAEPRDGRRRLSRKRGPLSAHVLRACRGREHLWKSGGGASGGAIRQWVIGVLSNIPRRRPEDEGRSGALPGRPDEACALGRVCDVRFESAGLGS